MWTDPAAGARQYHDAANLEARRALHARFSTNPGDFSGWLFDHLQATVPGDAAILELGSGPGEFWRRNRARVPAGWRLTVTDASAGMIEGARQALGASSDRVMFSVIDARTIPAPDACYDAVLAHFMLDHVPDWARALAEIRRVLRPGGVLHAATNGAMHLGRLRELLTAAGLSDQSDRGNVPGFSLETGAAQLRAEFDQVTLHRWPDSLAVTAVAPLLRAMLSSIDVQAKLAALGPDRAGERIARLAATLQAELDDAGVIRIAQDSGLFIAR